MRKVIAFLASITLLAAVAAPAFAASLANIGIPVDGSLSNPCSGETVDLTGTLHLQVTGTLDSAGGEHFDVHLNSQGISGVGEDSGATYQANGAANLTLNFNAGGADNLTVPLNFQFVGQGQVPNLQVHVLVHFTANPDGTLTATTENLSLSCK